MNNDTNLASHYIFLDSDLAFTKLSDSNCIFYLQNPVNPPQPCRIMLQVNNFTMPFTMYVFNQYNNTLAFTNGTSITFPEGNYNVNQLVVIFNAKLIEAGSSIVSSYVTETNAIKFVNSSNISIDTDNTTCLYEIGFLSTDTQSSTSIQSTESVNVSGINSVYIRCKNLLTENLDSGGQFDDTLARIPITCNPYQYIFFHNTDNMFVRTINNHFNFLHISLEDAQGRNLLLRNAKWSMTLIIHYQLHRHLNYEDLVPSTGDLIKKIKNDKPQNKKIEK